MDLYQGWFDLKPGVSDVEVSDRLASYMERLQQDGQIAGWRLMRRKLGLGPADLGEFHLIIELEDLAQLDRAFHNVSTRSDPTESLHHALNSQIANVRFALYRDFPDAHRQRGQEKF